MGLSARVRRQGDVLRDGLKSWHKLVLIRPFDHPEDLALRGGNGVTDEGAVSVEEDVQRRLDAWGLDRVCGGRG